MRHICYFIPSTKHTHVISMLANHFGRETEQKQIIYKIIFIRAKNT